MIKRWVRYVMPIMVEVDVEADEVLRVVTLPDELQPDRDDRGHFLVYDELFVRQSNDAQPQIRASATAEAHAGYARLASGPPANWPDSSAWEEGFDLMESDERYGETDPYSEPNY